MTPPVAERPALDPERGEGERSEPRLSVGVIGVGRIGRLHAEHLAYRIPNARLLMVADLSADAARRCARHCGIPETGAVGDYRRLLENPAIEAVVICSATPTHAPLIAEAAAAGKHIFCEKPIALRLDDIDRALAAVARAGVAFQVGFNRRFDTNFQRARRAVEGGEIGRPHLLHIISRDPAPPALDYVAGSGGIFLDMTIHDFDLARFLIGSEIEEVYAAAGVLVEPAIGALGDLDTALVTLKFANGALGTIDNSRRAVYGYDQRVEIFGGDGAVRVDNDHPNTAVIGTGDAIRRDALQRSFLDRYRESYVTEMQAFVDAALAGQPPPVSGADGRIAVVLGLAARRSYDENRPVRLL